jgi:hypothetical protein
VQKENLLQIPTRFVDFKMPMHSSCILWGVKKISLKVYLNCEPPVIVTNYQSNHQWKHKHLYRLNFIPSGQCNLLWWFQGDRCLSSWRTECGSEIKTSCWEYFKKVTQYPIVMIYRLHLVKVHSRGNYSKFGIRNSRFGILLSRSFEINRQTWVPPCRIPIDMNK